MCLKAITGIEESSETTKMFLLWLSLAFLATVSGHGGVLWPPTWQAGLAVPIEEIKNDEVFSEPKVLDPNSGRAVVNIKTWLTDQAYTGGVGDEFKMLGFELMNF